MKQTQQSLFPSMPAARSSLVKPAPAVRRRMPPVLQPRRAPLWLAVHLPNLSLETLLRGQPGTTPSAVIEAGAGVARIHAVDALAAAEGVMPGMTLAAGWSMLPGLAVHERDAAREQHLLRQLAARAIRFTPTVCLDESSLLLEVRGSLQMFKGACALRERVRDDMARLGFTAHCAMAPTPRAALWLARAGMAVDVDRPDMLARILGGLPLSAAGFDAGLLEKFRGVGARCVRDLLRLPRDGFARRYSARALRELDQALGRVPDVRRPLPPPKQFSARIDLLYEIHETARLVHPVRQLLRELDGYLQATQQGVNRLRLELVHRDGTFTAVVLGFAETTRDGVRILDLMEQKLESVALPAPALEVALHVDELNALAGRDRALFAEQRDDESWPLLVERLRVRLGAEAVTGIEQRADHRPERAWRHVVPGTALERTGIAGRPQWLLENPQALHVEGDKPCCGGPLHIIDGPERIETGWWDAADIARDYYIARDMQGRRLWICREVKTGCWWLQGIFG